MDSLTRTALHSPATTLAMPPPTASRFARNTLYGAMLLAALGSHPAQAGAGPVCETSLPSSRCAVTIAPGLTLESTLQNTVEQSDGTWTLSGTVNVIAPGGARIPLEEADLTVKLGTEPELYGESRLPLDSMPLVGNATDVTRVPRSVVGLVMADTLRELLGDDAPSLNEATAKNGSYRDASRPYLVFHVDAGFAFSLDLEGNLEALNEIEFVAPGSVKTTAVLDVFDPYIYLGYSTTGGIDLEGLKRDERDGAVVYEVEGENGEVVSTLTHDPENGTLVERDLVSGEVIEYRRDGDGDFVGRDAHGGQVTVAAAPFDLAERERRRAQDDKDDNRDGDKEGEGMPIDAIGYSLNGWIPFAADDAGELPDGLDEFAGQLYLHGEIPLTPTVEIDGEVVTYVGVDGLSQGGNGTVSLGIPGLPDFIDFDIELGNASAALTVTDTAQKVFVSGELDPDIAFLADLLPILPAPGAKVDGYVGNDLANTFLAIEGEMSVGAQMIGDALGVDMDDMKLLAARMIVDRHGFEVSGTARLQISPDIRLNSSVEVYAAMSWDDPTDLTVSLTGNMDVFGVALEDVTLEIGSGGVLVNGAFVTPISRIALDGRITSAGPSLSGTAAIVLDLGEITGSLRDAHATLSAAQAEVAELEREVAAMRNVVREERAVHDRALEAAKGDLSRAQGVVNTLKSQIAAKHRAIANHRSAIAAKYRWYQAAKWHQKAARWASYTADKSWRNAQIGAIYAQIGALEASRVVANTALDVAKAALSGVQAATVVTPIDLDPRVAALITAKEAANLALEAAKAPLAGVPQIDARIDGKIALSLGTGGLSGTVTAAVNGGPALSGTLAFTPLPRACIDVGAFGTACTPL